MISKQKIYLIIIAVLFSISLVVNITRLFPESRNYDNYIQALNEYNENNFADAYYTFGKVSRFSKLKPAAVYRQALCAGKLEDTKTEVKKYKQIIRYYSDSTLVIRAKYLKAQKTFESDKIKKAKKEFKHIYNQYPKTDYGLAAQYYLGLIEIKQMQDAKTERKKLKAEKTAIQYFKTYIKEAPTGRFAVSCVVKWLSLNPKLTNEDNLLIARAYQANQDYNNARKYLKLTNLSLSWPYLVENAYSIGNYANVRYYTEHGLKGSGTDDILVNENTERDNVYKAIDTYIKVDPSPKAAISYLLSIANVPTGKEYLLYKTCTNLPASRQNACFNSLYYKYPDGQFAAESLANIFYDKVQSQKYFMAKKLATMHLRKFKEAKSTPKVMFWLAKVCEKTKHYEEAKNNYRKLLRRFPDDYYAYHAFLNLNRLRYLNIIGVRQKPVLFPYKDSNSELITELVKVHDYGLINQLYRDDKFIQSWLFYQQGDFSNSARVARDAMDALEHKPDRFDLRWRLVYPVHYYDIISQNAKSWNNDPTLILAILREESYFNPTAQSHVGATGLMQLMPVTAREAAITAGMHLPNINMLADPEINIKLGNVYYSDLKRKLSGKDILAVLAYNGGLGSVSRWKKNLDYVDIDDFVEQIPYPETQNYLKKVYRSYWNYLRIYDGIKF